MRRCLPLAVTAAALAAVAASALPSSAGAPSTGRFAPVDRPGPALREPVSVLKQNLRCASTVNRQAEQQTVLLVPGTFVDPATNYDATYRPALEARGIPTCTITLPRATTGDAQASGERVAFAVREIAKRTGRKVDVLGYSQGGLVPRFAFRFFPDTRRLVDDFVALAPTNHGTLDADALCTLPVCQPGVIQQRTGSQFLQAVNSGQETFRPIDYTVVYTRTDEVATPNLDASGTSALRTGDARVRNVAIQDVCPLDLSEHLLLGTVDNTAFRLALDAFTHPGPALPSRLPASTCADPFLPGVTPAEALDVEVRIGAVIAQNLLAQPRVTQEPALRRYTLR